MSWVSGTVGLIEDKFNKLSDDHVTVPLGEKELDRYIDVKEETMNLSGGVLAQSGLIAGQGMLSKETVNVRSSGSVSIGSTRELGWIWSKFWVVPGRFVVIENTKNDLAFDVISESKDIDVSNARFNMSKIISDFPGQWMGGFQDRPDRVRAGTLFGEEIEEDVEMGDAFLRADKNQIGPKIEYQGEEVKVRITKDGLVQVVSPGNWRREKYLSLIDDVILDYAR